MALRDRILPKYTLGEELWNSITHGIGGALGVVSLVLCLLVTIPAKNVWGTVSAIIYSITLIILYVNSCVYHGLGKNNGKRVMRIIDHCSIYLLIAGTYTPYTLVALRRVSPGWGWSIFGVVWSAGILGIVLNAISIERFKVFSMVCYLAMGWSVIVAISPMLKSIPGNGMLLLLAGGIAYTVGAVFYGLGAKKRYRHSVFHVFVLIGSVLHFLSIYFYVLQ